MSTLVTKFGEFKRLSSVLVVSQPVRVESVLFIIKPSQFENDTRAKTRISIGPSVELDMAGQTDRQREYEL